MRVFKTLICITLSLSMFGCANNSIEKKEKSSQSTNTVQIKASPDKYTQYVKNYVGKNCANVGYKSMGGDRMDRYGNEAIKIVMVTEDGKYPGDEDDDLKGYVVVQQNLKPNTEIKMTYQKKEDGEEYDNLVDELYISAIQNPLYRNVLKNVSKPIIHSIGKTEKKDTVFTRYEFEFMLNCLVAFLKSEDR